MEMVFQTLPLSSILGFCETASVLPLAEDFEKVSSHASPLVSARWGVLGRKTAVVLRTADPGIAPESHAPLRRTVAAAIFGTANGYQLVCNVVDAGYRVL